MAEPRFRINNERKFVLPGIPIRPVPLFTYDAPERVDPLVAEQNIPRHQPVVHRPPVPLAPAPQSADYQRAVKRLAESIKPQGPARYWSPAPERLQRAAPPTIRPPVPPGAPAAPYYRPPVPNRNMRAPEVVLPPVPVISYPDVGPDDIGPVGPPLSVSLADIGPVGDFPDMPDWLIEDRGHSLGVWGLNQSDEPSERKRRIRRIRRDAAN